ncbi:alpha/beta fold hydrolase [Deinococcus cavernae]|uniref:Alpha/beta fold hydrolase n=1 Tax=Deinococcus cavernae TaxID=2320857 RepID=A0A418V7P2_9DEIO|nr:alpha/beta hydrolase [Deinococcus cavernae]RJF72113.1 alpha/beta fold hydrolase [Deinococcus cavernae]
MRRHLIASLTLWLLGSLLPVQALGGSAAITSRSLTLTLGDTTSKAELLLPPGSMKAPLVLLIQGTGPEDRNGSFVTFSGVQQGSLGQLANALAEQGFAVMRFDKRHAALTFDPKTAQAAQASYEELSMKDLLADARTALNTAKMQPGVDSSRVFVYGWSEGSILAAHLALETGAKGLIVQGPVLDSYAATFTRQFGRVGLKYLSAYAKDGKIDLQGVMAALMGPGSGLARTQAQLLLALDSTPDKPKLNTYFDANRDGRLDLKGEVLPALQVGYPQLLDGSPKYGAVGGLPVLGKLAPKLRMPVLILQGENDGNIDPDDARKLSALLPKTSTLKLYPGLGHSLGKAADITQDNFAPMQTAPMNDIAQWLKTLK